MLSQAVSELVVESSTKLYELVGETRHARHLSMNNVAIRCDKASNTNLNERLRNKTIRIGLMVPYQLRKGEYSIMNIVRISGQ